MINQKNKDHRKVAVVRPILGVGLLQRYLDLKRSLPSNMNASCISSDATPCRTQWVNQSPTMPAATIFGMKKDESNANVDLMFRAFSDRTRLRILHVLQDGELCVGDIVEILNVPQPRVSRHLAYLRKSNLVKIRKAGTWSHYSLSVANSTFHKKLLECLANCFCEVPEIQADSARAKKISKSGGCCPARLSSNNPFRPLPRVGRPGY